ncbi:MAG TPA: glycosyltransferase family 2 protein [Desulfobacteraceae bacterium]|nr:glycosyltransferase family 2 protein [Desulfobacteraceae bacterium]
MVVIIPALNEEDTVGSVVQDVKEMLCCEVVVIDDASTDKTAQAARDAGAVLLPHAVRLGAWGAIRTGFRYALRNDFDVAVTMDADGQHPIEAADRIAASVKKKQTDVAIGSCISRGSAARRFVWPLLRNMAMLDTLDITSGLRAYSRPAIKTLLSGNNTVLLDYQDIGVLLHLKKRGFNVLEIPVSMASRKNGKSKIFSSWAAVFCYLYKTGVLCLAKI